jgi:hypothetical protein
LLPPAASLVPARRVALAARLWTGLLNWAVDSSCPTHIPKGCPVSTEVISECIGPIQKRSGQSLNDSDSTSVDGGPAWRQKEGAMLLVIE